MDILTLYELDQKSSIAGFGIKRYTETFSQLAAAANLTASSTICPADAIRVLTRLSYYQNAGAAQTIIAAGAFAQAGFQILAGSDIHWNEYYYQGNGLISYGQEQVCELVVMPGESVQVIGNFSAGVAINAVTAWIHGYEIPRGNWRF